MVVDEMGGFVFERLGDGEKVVDKQGRKVGVVDATIGVDGRIGRDVDMADKDKEAGLKGDENKAEPPVKTFGGHGIIIALRCLSGSANKY